jgi:hypothetical protein
LTSKTDRIDASENGATDSFALKPPGPLGYLMPEFQGQTHIWFDRELSHMREFNVDVRLFSTRPPPEESAARHAFAERARRETTYLWPRPMRSILSAVAWRWSPALVVWCAPQPTQRLFDGMSLRERASALTLLFPRPAFSPGRLPQAVSSTCTCTVPPVRR